MHRILSQYIQIKLFVFIRSNLIHQPAEGNVYYTHQVYGHFRFYIWQKVLQLFIYAQIKTCW